MALLEQEVIIKEAVASLRKAKQALAKLNRAVASSQKKQAIAKRPRRSRQCRGRRARNYVRALAREAAASHTDSTPVHLRGFGDSKRIRDEAEKTGALAEHRRLNDERAKAARKRGGEA